MDDAPRVFSPSVDLKSRARADDLHFLKATLSQRCIGVRKRLFRPDISVLLSVIGVSEACHGKHDGQQEDDERMTSVIIASKCPIGSDGTGGCQDRGQHGGEHRDIGAREASQRANDKGDHICLNARQAFAYMIFPESPSWKPVTRD